MKISTSEIKIYQKADCHMPTSIFDILAKELNTVYTVNLRRALFFKKIEKPGYRRNIRKNKLKNSFSKNPKISDFFSEIYEK